MTDLLAEIIIMDFSLPKKESIVCLFKETKGLFVAVGLMTGAFLLCRFGCLPPGLKGNYVEVKEEKEEDKD